MSERDFDFLHGSWRVEHRLLTLRLAESNEWRDFITFVTCRPLLGGWANLDESGFISHGYHHAITLRLYDDEQDAWSMYWITNRSPDIGSPLIGQFTGTVGEFIGDSMLDGMQVVCRHPWFADGPDICRCEQAMSSDGGTTWETNWHMSLTRVR